LIEHLFHSVSVSMNRSRRHTWPPYQPAEHFLQRRRHGLTVRDLAAKAGLSLGVASDALNRSSWPRWSTLEAIAGAIQHELRLSSEYEVPLYELPFLVGDKERSMTFVARAIGVRPETLLEMTRGDRSPLASTVLALTDWCDETVTLEPNTKSSPGRYPSA
jgi:lambda repressor-like predicted transcriptional regulator